jgi:hypothetical protein
VGGSDDGWGSTRRNCALVAARTPVAEAPIVGIPFAPRGNPAIAQRRGGSLSERRKPTILLCRRDMVLVHVPILSKAGRSGGHKGSNAERNFHRFGHVRSPSLCIDVVYAHQIAQHVLVFRSRDPKSLWLEREYSWAVESPYRQIGSGAWSHFGNVARIAACIFLRRVGNKPVTCPVLGESDKLKGANR